MNNLAILAALAENAEGDVQKAAILDAFTKSGMLNKAPATVTDATLLAQPTGMFAVHNMETDVLGIHTTPQGIGAVMPAIPNNTTDPRYGVWTGFGDDVGSEPVDPCGDAPTGVSTSAVLTATFGHVTRDTKTVEIQGLVEQIRGGNSDLNLISSIYGQTPMSPTTNVNGVLNMVVQHEMASVGVRMERKLAKMLWNGNPANNTANGGYKEFDGLDRLIKTGYVDAETAGAVPSIDSTIVDFAFEPVDSTTTDIVATLARTEHYLYTMANRTGMAPVTWRIAMRADLWHHLTAVWPCRYLTDNCRATNDNDGQTPVVLNDSSQTDMRDAMREGMYLPLNGRRYSVVLDDGMTELTNSDDPVNLPNADDYSSSIAFLPMTVRGNFPSLYWQYMNFTGINEQLAGMPGRDKVNFWTDQGKFMWAIENLNFCFKLKASVTPRAILRTPWLAARIDDIKYSTTLHTVTPFPGDAGFRGNDGVSSR